MLRRARFSVEPAARQAHGIEPPAMATRLPAPKKAADFSPWTGSHPEDVLNETVIKAGYFDKGQGTNHSESNSAKATIWPSLTRHNRPALHCLSVMFMQVMEKRQQNGKCTAPSTFKPPPRVTVTDTKREAWLRDLANPDVPLRKQSRTIPHGIRGKLLMEQCLSKDIPLQRAVWLAKCVGANELRAFRRKGVSGSAAASGETKWVHDWTVSVEQFLEGVIGTCGQTENWQAKMNYAMKLAAALYAEKLMDTYRFLDWIVASFSDAPMERLPVWIVMVQIHWKGITMYGRRGRKLAEGILEHLHKIAESNLDVNATLKIRLQKLIAVMAVSSRGCLVVPQAWEKYGYLLVPANNNTATNTPANNIRKRNERLAGPLLTSGANIRSPVLDLYSGLDSIALNFDVESVATRCSTLISCPFTLVKALLDWASTPYRTGVARVYITSSIIARLHSTGLDTDAAVLQYLSNANTLSAYSSENVHYVVVDLVRLKAFSIGRYFQWLITSGVLSTSDSHTCGTSLIAALPPTGLPLHMSNTRKTLMRRLGYAWDETAAIDAVLIKFDDATSRPLTESNDLVELPVHLTTSAKFSISQRTCSKLCTAAKDVGISLSAFIVARDVAERTQDISSLAALVMAASTSDNGAMLATVTDTINLYSESFTALGHFSSMVETITERYLTVRSQQPPDRTLILALTSLTGRLPHKSEFVKLLNDDLAICDQQSSLAVCSPASDSLIGMHATSLDSEDDVDAVFASGNTMDEQLMQRVFMRIILRTNKFSSFAVQPVSKVCGWLNQLKAVNDSALFDRLVQNYIRNLLKGIPDGKSALAAIPALVASGSITLETVADIAKDLQSPQIASALLSMLLSGNDPYASLTATERYSYRLQQERCQSDYSEVLIRLVRIAADASVSDVDMINTTQYIIRRVTVQPGSVRSIFEDGQSSDTLVANAGRILTAVLERGQSPIVNGPNLDVTSIVKSADALSIRYCVGTLRYFKVTCFTPELELGLGDALLQAFIDRSDVWPQLLDVAGDDTKKRIHEWAQGQLLDIADHGFGIKEEESSEHMQRCLKLLAATSRISSGSDDTSSIAIVTEKLGESDRQLSDLDDHNSAATPRSRYDKTLHHLRIVLHLCVVHVHALPDETESMKQARCNLLSSLCTLLVHRRLQTHVDLIEYLFDLSSTLADSLSDLSWAALKLDSAKSQDDPRLLSILGDQASSAGNWLALASQVNPSLSQQQRALNRHQLQQSAAGTYRSSTSGQAGPSPIQPQQHARWPSQPFRQDTRMPAETKITPYSLRPWEVIPDPTPVMGENDVSLSLGLFGARKV